MDTINWFAVLAAAASTFCLGGIWYAPFLFGKAWQAECGLTDEQMKHRNMGKIFGLAFLWALIMAVNLAFFFNDPKIGLQEGMLYGFATGFGFVAMAIFTTGQFESRSTRYMLINGGYFTLAFTIMGAIIGGWK